jgi:hypothetical protein
VSARQPGLDPVEIAYSIRALGDSTDLTRGNDGNGASATTDAGRRPDHHVFPSMSVAELFAEEPKEPAWIVPGYVAGGCVTEIDAKIKAGKTHFLADMVAAVLAGRHFLSRETVRVPIVYLTEEGKSTFRSVLARVGFETNQDAKLQIVFRSQMRGWSWEVIAERAGELAERMGAGMVVIDTLSSWAGLKDDNENDSGAALAAMRPLRELAASGLAVVTCRHERKGGGEVGDSARGSSAFGGESDIIVALQRVSGQGHEVRRQLKAVGRLDGVPPNLMVELRDGHYVSLGEESAVEYQDVRRALGEQLGDSRELAQTIPNIVESLGKARGTVQRVLKEMQEHGEVAREKGAGGCDSRAFGHWLLAPAT